MPQYYWEYWVFLKVPTLHKESLRLYVSGIINRMLIFLAIEMYTKLPLESQYKSNYPLLVKEF